MREKASLTHRSNKTRFYKKTQVVPPTKRICAHVAITQSAKAFGIPKAKVILIEETADPRDSIRSSSNPITAFAIYERNDGQAEHTIFINAALSGREIGQVIQKFMSEASQIPKGIDCRRVWNSYT